MQIYHLKTSLSRQPHVVHLQTFQMLQLVVLQDHLLLVVVYNLKSHYHLLAVVIQLTYQGRLLVAVQHKMFQDRLPVVVGLLLLLVEKHYRSSTTKKFLCFMNNALQVQTLY
jgi:hypothetical protein